MTVDEVYNRIGEAIIDAIQEDWKSAKLDIEAYSDYIGLNGEYITANNEKRDMKVRKFSSFNVQKAIIELLSITTESGNNKWNRAVFKLTPDSSFDMEFIWDQELDDKIKNA